MEQHVVSMMIQLVRGFTNLDWTPPRVHLQTYTLKGAENTSSLKNSQVVIEKKYTGICIPFDILANPPTSKNLGSGTKFNVELGNIPKINAQVIKELIAQSSYTRSLKAEQVAQILAISVRQMQRTLKQENTTFKTIAEEILVAEAKKMLSEQSRPIVDIAAEFGYTEQANFTRAFKRLVGVSPSQYRQGYNK